MAPNKILLSVFTLSLTQCTVTASEHKGCFVVSLLQKRPREIKWLAQGHTSDRPQVHSSTGVCPLSHIPSFARNVRVDTDSRRDSTYLLGVLKAKIHCLGKVSVQTDWTVWVGTCWWASMVQLGGGVSRIFKEVPHSPPPSCTISIPLSNYFIPTYGSPQETVSYLDILCTYEEKRGKDKFTKHHGKPSHDCNSFIQVCVCSGGETRLRSALCCNTIRGLAIEPSLLGIPS